MVYRAIVALALAGGLAGCGFVPTNAPTASEFSQTGVDSNLTYSVIGLDPAIVQALASYQYPGLASVLGNTAYRPDLALMPGDVVSITIFDVSAQPLLGTAPSAAEGTTPALPITGHTTVIPSQVVELNGTVKIPFGGTIKVAGLTPMQAARQIEHALKGQATAPQAIVSLESSALHAVTVGGDVMHPGIVPLTVRGERVLDVIAAAGGAKFEPFDCDVQLIRHSGIVKVGLQDVVDHANENVNVEPGDSLYVSHDPRTFSVLGSAMKVSQYNFDTERVTLAEAIARAGGPNDATANISNVYLLRYEARGLADSILPAGGAPAAGDRIPVAYHLDLRHGGGYFLAQAVQVHDKDVILMTDANAVQLQKIFGFIRSMSGIYFDLKRNTIQ